jgi:hypothetical protein
LPFFPAISPGFKDWLAISPGKNRYFLTGKPGFREYDFSVRHFIKAPWAGVWRQCEKACQEGTMGTLVFLGVIMVGSFLGIMLISLLRMAQKAEEVYERMQGGDKLGPRSDTYCLLASETLSPAVGARCGSREI